MINELRDSQTVSYLLFMNICYRYKSQVIGCLPMPQTIIYGHHLKAPVQQNFAFIIRTTMRALIHVCVPRKLCLHVCTSFTFTEKTPFPHDCENYQPDVGFLFTDRPSATGSENLPRHSRTLVRLQSSFVVLNFLPQIHTSLEPH